MILFIIIVKFVIFVTELLFKEPKRKPNVERTNINMPKLQNTAKYAY